MGKEKKEFERGDQASQSDHLVACLQRSHAGRWTHRGGGEASDTETEKEVGTRVVLPE